ncbi:CYFA0S01e19856g1_1 [Cyberlindnera fabianii]|uniref:ribonuclease H n=1 Tax=Cyberlindnera fabianii TaxID=36022 RepID=A0A061AKD6_CYBFA|nr:CYFA0S01e19856g1_1 [Cyberlindnera fabianii]
MKQALHIVQRARNSSICSNCLQVLKHNSYVKTGISIYASGGSTIHLSNDFSHGTFGTRPFSSTPTRTELIRTTSSKVSKPTILETSNGPFYSVAVGREPGIYTTWDACQTQVKSFPHARFKKFKDYASAKAFLTRVPDDFESHTRNLIHSAPVSTPTPKGKPVYAVSYGDDQPGQIFDSWAECQEAIMNKKGVTFKKFEDLAAAEEFIEVEPKPEVSEHHRQISVEEFLSNNSLHVLRKQQAMAPKYVYADGSYTRGSDGKVKAGYGVYFGENDHRNVSSPLIMDEVDSYIAEVHAARAALKLICADIKRYDNGDGDYLDKYILMTDSETVINLLNTYAPLWSDADYAKRRAGQEMRDIVKMFNFIKDYYAENPEVFGDHRFEVKWVKGHAGHPGNEMADLLAKEGANAS